MTAAPLPHALAHVAMLLAATAGLHGIAVAIRAAPCVGAYVLVAAIAWPIWRYRREYALFERRAILTGVMRDDSRLRRWLWPASVSRSLQAVAALAWAALLLGFALQLGDWHWGVLYADAVLLGLLVRPVTLRLAGEVRREQLGIAARRWPLALINLAALAVAFFVVDYFFAGAPDTRGMAWHVVAERAYAAASAPLACTVAGAVAGALAAADALAWHAAQVIIPSLSTGALRWAAWIAFLLQAGIVALAVTRMHLGVVATLDRAAWQPATPPESSRPFTLTVLGLLLAAVLAAYFLRDFDRAALAERGRTVVAWANPCRADAASVPALRSRLDGELRELREAEHARAGERIDAVLDASFAEAEKGVEAYLDWYFSILGEYQRLGAALTGRLEASMREQLEARVMGEGFTARLEEAGRMIAAETEARVAQATARLGADIRSEARARPCLLERVDLGRVADVERDALRVGAAAGGGVAAALATRALARRAATAAVTRTASRRIFQGAASLGGRVVGKRAGSTIVAAAGGAAACGPLAPLCALAVGGITWITLDKAMVEIDELRFRDAMREEILESLRAQKAQLAQEMRAVHAAALDPAIDAIDRSLQQVFIPARS